MVANRRVVTRNDLLLGPSTKVGEDEWVINRQVRTFISEMGLGGASSAAGTDSDGMVLRPSGEKSVALGRVPRLPNPANMGHPRLKIWIPFESCAFPVGETNETNREGHISQTPAAHCTRKSPLPLLPSGPGGIGGSASRGTDV